jgi:type VI secretion system lysozyme-like protein
MHEPTHLSRRGLLARLTGAALDEHASLLTSLRLLLNTRVGESAAAPDFGVPDLADLLHQFPAASAPLQQAVRAAIARHEPRLRGVTLRPLAGPPPGFLISASFRGAPLQLRVTLGLAARLEVA